MGAREEISLEALSLGEGCSVRIVCPFCRDESEQSLSIWRNNGIIGYRCWRVTCDKKGLLTSSGVIEKRKGKKFTPKICKEPMQNPPSVMDRWLERNYEISRELSTLNRFKYLHCSHRIYMPVFGNLGQELGGVAKHVKKGAKPKTVLYRNREALFLHYAYRVTQGDTVCVVEDILSSVKVSKLMPCVALLGTNMTDEMAYELAKEFKTIKIFLDLDAVDKANKIARRYRALADIQVIVNDKDPKDTPYGKLEELLNGGKNTPISDNKRQESLPSAGG